MQPSVNPNYKLMLTSIVIVGCWLALLLLAFKSPLGQDLNFHVARTLEFRFREFVGNSPKLHPKIKIFGFDDKSLSLLKRPELFIEEWAAGLKQIASYKPKMIIIDKMFSIIYDPNHKQQFAKDMLLNLSVPITVGSFSTPHKVPFRDQLDTGRRLFDLRSLRDSGIVPTKENSAYYSKFQVIKKDSPPVAVSFKQMISAYSYGPKLEFQNVFSYTGHLFYSGQLKTAPLIQVRENQGILHAGIFAADDIKVDAEHFMVNGLRVPLDDRGEVIVNISPPQTYYANQKRLNVAFAPIKKGRKPVVEEGDIVLILLHMYTGGTDFHLTPFGYVPGGFFLASMINSTLSGSWLGQMDYPLPSVVLAALAGSLLGVFAGAIGFWILLISALIVIVLVGLLLFSFGGIVVPWIWWALAFTGSATILFSDRAKFAEKRVKKLMDIEDEKKKLAKELRDASEMAEAYKPDALPSWESFCTMSGFHQSIHMASGDWFAFESSRSGKYFHVIMCDITGHGVQAALVVSACKVLLETIRDLKSELVEQEDFIAEYMSLLNETLWKQGKGQHVTTLLGLTFIPDENRMVYIGAGHPFALLRSKVDLGKRPRALISRHNPLGVMEECNPILNTCSYETEDELIIYTDGVPLLENRNLLKTYPRFNADSQGNQAKNLYDAIWKHESKKSAKLADDDVSIIWIHLK